jgi:hypothetical protein
MSLASLASLARRWLVAAVAAAGDGQNILPMNITMINRRYRIKVTELLEIISATPKFSLI